MYNRQILADHFNGKRDANDPEVQREFALLKQQAQIDWNEMYAGKGDPRVTAQSIEEDYIYSAQSVAKTQLLLKRIKIIVTLAVLAVVALIFVLKK